MLLGRHFIHFNIHAAQRHTQYYPQEDRTLSYNDDYIIDNRNYENKKIIMKQK